MEKKRATWFLKAMIYLLTGLTVLCLVWRNEIVLGTGLIVGRWLMVLLAGWYLFRLSRRAAPKRFRVMVWTVLGLLLGEFTWLARPDGH